MSISVISVLPEAEKQRAWQRISAVFTEHPSLAGQTVYTLPYVTECYWSYKL